jgi:hypothetical protein
LVLEKNMDGKLLTAKRFWTSNLLEKYLVLKNRNRGVKLPLPFAHRVTTRATAGLLLYIVLHAV